MSGSGRMPGIGLLGYRATDARYSIVETYFADRMERTITLS
jgi:hypothetical protein